VLQEEVLNITKTLARYNACLKKEYGIDLNDIGAESAAAWGHLVAAGQKGLEPQMAVRQLANVFGLVPAGSMFAPMRYDAEVYNRYRLALMNYAEGKGLDFHSPSNSPVQRVEDRDMFWDVEVMRRQDGSMKCCMFRLYDPVQMVSHVGYDIDDTLERARTAILKAENTLGDRPINH
jgi:hypothetical protein